MRVTEPSANCVCPEGYSPRLLDYARHAAILIVCLLAACADAGSEHLAKYLEGAEIQAETQEQRAVLAQALSDMLRLPPTGLRAARYGPDNRPLPDLLRAHLVPSEPVPLDDEEVYSQAGEPRARAAIESLRIKLSP